MADLVVLVLGLLQRHVLEGHREVDGVQMQDLEVQLHRPELHGTNTNASVHLTRTLNVGPQ
jgi:hypothetical protein